MKRKALFIASLAAFACSCQQAQPTSNKPDMEDQNFQQRRKDMQQQTPPKPQTGGCCEAPKTESTEATAPNQTAAAPEVKVETKE
ncbi:MAG: hypothetical protein K1X28_06315 [Parachlamydiales bacterium]|nr:hypothetical protein [Parachlamydiales bacterium]